MLVVFEEVVFDEVVLVEFVVEVEVVGRDMTVVLMVVLKTAAGLVLGLGDILESYRFEDGNGIFSVIDSSARIKPPEVVVTFRMSM